MKNANPKQENNTKKSHLSVLATLSKAAEWKVLITEHFFLFQSIKISSSTAGHIFSSGKSFVSSSKVIRKTFCINIVKNKTFCVNIVKNKSY